LLQAGLVPQAERTLKDLAVRARRGPMADEAWFRLERLYYQSGDYQQALGAFSKISERPAEPIRPEALYLAGNSYLRLNDDRKAIDLLDRVGGGNESYPFALYSSGLARLRLKETGHSMPGPFRKLMAIHPGEDPVLRELIHKTRVTVGFFLNDQKRYPEAIALFETVPPKSVYRIPARFGIGISYLGMEECVKAVVVFGELIEQAPTDPYALEARLYVGTCYAKLNAYHKAMERYLDALAAYSARKENLKKLAERIQKLGAASTGADLIPADLRRELAIDRDFPELVEVYDDWFRLYGQISRIDPETQGRKAPAAGPDLKTMRDRTQEVRRELDGLLRTAMTDQVSARMERIDELVRRANIGITKNMILVQDHESAP
ncbi:MAG TPA: tetratricopeptide repeat protein, partial [Nitrospiria bacterium]